MCSQHFTTADSVLFPIFSGTYLIKSAFERASIQCGADVLSLETVAMKNICSTGP